MAGDVGWFRQTLSNISNEIEVNHNLSELKIALTSVNLIQMKTLALNLDLGVIFDCLNSSDNQQIELGCHVLEELLPYLEPAVLLNKYGVAMHRALSHPNETVKQVVLTEMCRAVKDSDLVSRMGDQQALLLSVVECVGNENMSVAKIAISFLVWMGQTPSYLHTLLSPQLMQAFNTVKKKNDTTRFRVIVEVSSTSSPGLEACHNSGLLSELLDETKQKSDILAKLTAIELITKLALTHHGMDYLEKHGVTDVLPKELVGCNDGSPESFVIPGDAMSTVMQNLNQLIKSASPDLRVRPLNTIANIIGLEVSINFTILISTSELLQLTEQWYLSISDSNPTLSFMNICHLPFPELRLAGFLILQKMAIQVWGQKQILNCPVRQNIFIPVVKSVRQPAATRRQPNIAETCRTLDLNLAVLSPHTNTRGTVLPTKREKE
ncbi:hypothetical protein LSTR_LSTR012739 [Laodelphax striatellus]|uniref:26S proteasome non-ATPase regulatory subunit 5 n=1 Tax=Laodelphax striatellus TaxID=195883 RepID=A0A482X738_LAOST|nr:hypothetical protein LSTR_LSTR012739 [Laodelphax striatellus]